jgi:hypothetical protein|tara:strand:- start:129 stop:722 length:594 start_codon:yes stop_codon:yes gene_type:complete
MPMPAVLATIAQQGQAGGGGGSAPTGVAIYHANGGTQDAVLAENLNLGSSGEQPVDDLHQSDFSSGSATMTLNYNANYSAAVNNNGGRLLIRVYGYIEATGATSFAWDADTFATVQDNAGAVSSWTGIGTASTNQDATSSGIGEDAVLQHNSGGRGYLLLQPGIPTNDAVRWDIEASATNSSGTTAATSLRITLESQ